MSDAEIQTINQPPAKHTFVRNLEGQQSSENVSRSGYYLLGISEDVAVRIAVTSGDSLVE
jgi:hypothetical protein